MKRAMNYVSKASFLAAALALTACGGIETATRNAPLEQVGLKGGNAAVERLEPMSIASYRVNVSRDLRVSEANRYYPGSDIVWRGDEIGDRHQQVAAIFEQSIVKSAGLIQSGRPADIHIEVKRFHSLTEKARATVGGVHSMKFEISATDAETGAVLMSPRLINGDLKAFGGSNADNADQKGFTQKFRITNHLTKIIYQQMTGKLPQMTKATQKTETAPVVASGQIKQF